MTKLDGALDEIWTATKVVDASAAFNAAVLERIARRRVLKEMAMAAVIAVAVWAVSLGMGEVLSSEAGLSNRAFSEAWILASCGVVATGLALFAALRMGRGIERGFWSLGLLR